MITAYVGLGSNVGDRLGNLSRAVDAIAHVPETHVTEVSRAYESEPAYKSDQPLFLNAVVEVETTLTAVAFFSYLTGIEDEMGRVREIENGPRVIDLDLLIFGDEEMSTPELTLPHPRMAERDFVLTPLLEISLDVKLPEGALASGHQKLVGPVIRDYGHIPDAGAEHNMPIEETEWVVVAETDGPQSAIGGYDAGVQFSRQVLEQEGIPYAFEPFEPGRDVDILARPRIFKLAVPASHARHAKELLAEVQAAGPVEPGDDRPGSIRPDDY